MYSEFELKRHIGTFRSELPISKTFEENARVGVGFQGKWYRSQREHWLGWISVKERKDGIDLASSHARRRWSGLSSPPMLIWLAEAAGVAPELVERAAAAAASVIGGSGKESARAAKAVRDVLRWEEVETKLSRLPAPSPEMAHRIDAEATLAWECMIAHNPRYR